MAHGCARRAARGAAHAPGAAVARSTSGRSWPVPPGSRTPPPVTRSSGPAPLRAMLGHPPAASEVSRQVLARYVHRDDHAKALGAITQAWTGRGPVRITVRLMRADGGWFDVDCRLEPVNGPDGTVRGIRGTVRDVSARERARREVARLARRGETVQSSLVDPDPATGLLTRARFADEIDRAQRRGGGAVLVIRVQAEPNAAPSRYARSATPTCCTARPGCSRASSARRACSAGSAPTRSACCWPAPPGRWPAAQAELLVEALRAQPFVLPDAWLRAHAWAGLVRFPPDAEAGSHDLLIDAEHAWRQSRDADRPLTLVGAPGAGPRPAGLLPQPGRRRARHRPVHPLLASRSSSCRPTRSPGTSCCCGCWTRPTARSRRSRCWTPPSASTRSTTSTCGWSSGPCSSPPSTPDLCLQINLSGRSVGDPRLTAEVERLIERYRVNPDAAHLRDHRDRADRQPAARRAASPTGSATSAASWRWTTSGRATPRSATCGSSRSTWSRSTGSTWSTWSTTRRTRCWSVRWCRSARRTGSTPWPSSCRTSRPCGCCASWASTTSRAT